MSDPTTTTVIKILVLSVLAIAIQVSYHLGRTASDHPSILEEPTMGCEIVDPPPPHWHLVPRNLQCKPAGDGAFLCK